MIYNSCRFPDSCDCLDCEEVNMGIKPIKDHPKYEIYYKRSKALKLQKLFCRKELNYKERKELIKYYFSDVEKEYNEANNATNIYNMFTEILEVMPKDILIDNNTIGLFKSALQDTIGTEIKTETIKDKIYI